MLAELSEVPEEYRGMFYPPVIQDAITFTDGDFDIDQIFKNFAVKRQEWVDRANIAFFLGETKGKSEEEKLLCRLKYAYIAEGDKRYITYVDNETMKAYRMHDNSYYDGLALPLTEVADFVFDRWCRGMDL